MFPRSSSPFVRRTPLNLSPPSHAFASRRTPYVEDGDAWVSVGDKVYDISHWIRRHPGGSIPLLQYAGRDMTVREGPGGRGRETAR